MKSLDAKLANIWAGRYTPRDFIIADAKDADMAFGLTASGGGETGGYKTRAAYLGAIGAIVRSDLIDILLASASTLEILAENALFAATPVTPAVRCNDTTDIWLPRGGRYGQAHSRPFRTANLQEVRQFTDLGLYSITFCNDPDCDLATLEAYAVFRREAVTVGMRYFLEVFNPPSDAGIDHRHIGPFVGDCIVRCLAGQVSSEQPVFLKVAFNGRHAMEELATYDPQRLIVGVLGGAKGTTCDTFELLDQASRSGARVALFGRKINYAEAPLILVRLMRRVIEGDVSPQEAVRLYHDGLQQAGIRPALRLEDDLAITDPVLKGVSKK